MSWLDDNQMHTAGYPNLKLVSTEYSEEDSRDAQVICVFHNSFSIC